MNSSLKVLAVAALASAAASFAYAQNAAPPAAQAPPANTKRGADASADLNKGPYFSVGPQFPNDPNAPARAGRGAAAAGGAAAGGRAGANGAPAAGRGAAAGAAGRGAAANVAAAGGPPLGANGVATFGTEDNAALIWEEHWTRAPLTQPMTQANLGNQNLRLHIYGDPAGIRKTAHANEDYTYTGESLNNWALTVSDPTSYWDLRVPGKILLRTRNTGYRVTHIIIKTPDGKYYASEEGTGESSAWVNRDYIFSDLHWRNLTMVDAPSNVASATRPVDPKRAVLVATSVATPDLSKVEEVGFSDLMPGGFIPATTRVNGWALFGKKVPR